MAFGRKILGALLLGAIVFTPTLGAAASASAADTQENVIARDVVNRITRGGEIVSIDPAYLSNKDLLEKKYFSDVTSVVAVKPEALGSYAPKDFSRFLVENDNPSKEPSALNILVLDKGTESKLYVSSPNEELQKSVQEILGTPAPDGSVVTNDPGWLILRHADAIKAAQDVYVEKPDTLKIVLIVFGVIFGIIFLIIGIVTLANYFERGNSYRRRENKRRAREKKAQEKAAKLKRSQDKKAAAEAAKAERAKRKAETQRLKERKHLTENLDKPVLGYISVLNQTAQDVSAQDERLAEGLRLVLERFSELYESLKLMEASEVQRGILEVEYGDRLEKLATIVGPKYYQDLKKNPEHWRDPEVKLDSIRLSVEKTAEQILENIRQLKEGSEFDFDLAIESILGFKVIDPKAMLK